MQNNITNTFQTMQNQSQECTLRNLVIKDIKHIEWKLIQQFTVFITSNESMKIQADQQGRRGAQSKNEKQHSRIKGVELMRRRSVTSPSEKRRSNNSARKVAYQCHTEEGKRKARDMRLSTTFSLSDGGASSTQQDNGKYLWESVPFDLEQCSHSITCASRYFTD